MGVWRHVWYRPASIPQRQSLGFVRSLISGLSQMPRVLLLSACLQGGTYEGEWASGVMSGTGLRTYSSGKVVAGRWEGGQLAAPLELWQCAAAAEGAAEAALAARR
jgi:hypothetical protein